MGTLVDLSFTTATGAIREYLVARSDPRLPGSSRWRLTPDRILDQRPGVVSTGLTTLEDLPLHRASLRQDLLQRTQRWRDQLRQMGDRAGDRLEGLMILPGRRRVHRHQHHPGPAWTTLILSRIGRMNSGINLSRRVARTGMRIPGSERLTHGRQHWCKVLSDWWSLLPMPLDTTLLKRCGPRD